MSTPVIKASVFFECQASLGEGVLWDSKAQLVHWVDINHAAIYSLDPKTKSHSIDTYPQTPNVTALALRHDKPGFIGLTTSSITLFPEPTTPTTQGVKTERKLDEVFIELVEKSLVDQEVRMNDGGCDPSGRFWGGSMGKVKGEKAGGLWRYEAGGKNIQFLDGVGCSNGIGWSPDGKIMYYTDSALGEISAFDYDVTTGTPSNRRVFASKPPPLDDTRPSEGVYDGLCMDGVGNVWSARWADQRVIGFRPDGSIICSIKVEGALSPTIPCFGGENLETMFIITAHSNLAGDKDRNDEFPHSGDLFSVDFSQGSEVRKLLGEGWKGAERHRYAA